MYNIDGMPGSQQQPKMRFEDLSPFQIKQTGLTVREKDGSTWVIKEIPAPVAGGTHTFIDTDGILHTYERKDILEVEDR